MKFSELFLEAKELFYSDVTPIGPIDPVVRWDGDEWYLESIMIDRDCQIEVDLEYFHSVFYEAYLNSMAVEDSDENWFLVDHANIKTENCDE